MSKILIIPVTIHDCAATILENGKITHYFIEERLSRVKHDGNFDAILSKLQIINNTNFDLMILPLLSPKSNHTIFNNFKTKKIVKNKNEQHHLNHAYSGFYSSPFDKALCFVFDGAGTWYGKNDRKNKEIMLDNITSKIANDFPNYNFCERESVFLLEKNKKHQVIHKNYCLYDLNIYKEYDDGTFIITEDSFGLKFNYLSEMFGFSTHDAGKVMGLSQYIKYNELLPKNYNNQKWKNYVFLANNLQNFFQEYVINMIKKYTKKTGVDNVIISGGCALNCVANYEYLKHVKPENLWIDPICFDAGISMGEAYRLIHENLIDNMI